MTSANQRLNDGTEATPATGKGLRLSPVPVERFDEYAVVARLGSGGMAEVILGLAQGPQGFRKLVAIKRLHAHCESDPELVRMFLHEASLAALLQHANVVQTYKVGTTAGRHFIAMEYLEGQPLHRALPRLRLAGAGLEPRLAVRVIADALAGLAYAHDALNYDGTPLDLVHRDVSPQNLFVTYDGQVKLLDFGVAKAAIAALDLHTQPGMIKGKLGYLAPEQANGPVDRRADLWSVGVVLWEALAGTRLFRGSDAPSKLRAALSDEIPKLRSLRPELPEALERIAARALRREREERYANANEMKAELDAWLASTHNGADKVAPDAVARVELASVMQSRFADEICARRAAVLECFAAVDHEQRWQHVSEASAQAPRSTTPPDEPPHEAPETKRKRTGLSVLGLCVAAVLLFLAGRALRPTAREVVAAGHANVARTGAAPLTTPAPAAAALSVERAQAPGPHVQSEEVAPTETKLEEARRPASARRLALKAARAPVVPVVAPSAPVVPVVAPSAPVVPVVAPSAPAAREPSAVGRLRLDATPYAVVSLEGKRLGITPIDVELPAASHTLTLRNPELGIETTYRVQVVAGESLQRKVELE